MSDPTPPYPPPGARPPEDAPPPPGARPGSGPAPAPGWAAYPTHPAYAGGHPGPVGPVGPVGMAGAAHRPGAVPLRPLTLGSIYDGAFRIIRYNPKATVGAATLVTAAAMLLPVVVSTVVALTVGTGFTAGGEIDPGAGTAELVGLAAAGGSLLLGLLAAQLGLIFVTGMIAHVTREAAVGRRATLGQAWAATAGRRWRLVALSLLTGLGAVVLTAVAVGLVVAVVVLTGDPLISVGVGVLATAGFVCVAVLLWVRWVYLAGAVLMLERRGVLAALGRSWTLTAAQFWRTFGIAVLTALVAGIAGSLLTTPLSIVGNVGTLLVPEQTLAILAVTQALVLVVQNACVAPFVAAVGSLQYLDLRIRKEGYDVELMREAGILPR